MRDNAGNIVYTAQQYAQGVLALTGAVRAAIQRIKPDATEVERGYGVRQHLGPRGSAEVFIASPVRYGIPGVRMFGNGQDLNGLHQFFAAGHNLALCFNVPGGGFMFDNAAHIKILVQMRVAYKDTLIYGAQMNQPSTTNPAVVAYQYLPINTCLSIPRSDA